MGAQEERATVLAVDDEPLNIILMEEVLRDKYRFISTHNGFEALAMARKVHPDVILLDVMLPDIDGFEVCRRIRSDPEGNDTKIILVTARAKLDERLRGYSFGADDYLPKPFEVEELEAKVRVFARLKNAEDELRNLNGDLRDKVSIRSKQLGQAEKMAALGRQAAGVVHNLNNPLAAILGYGNMIKESYPEDQRPEKLIHAGEEMTKILRGLLKAWRTGEDPQRQVVDLGDVLKAQMDMLRNNLFFKHKVMADVRLEKKCRVLGSPQDFGQVFGNLVKNAVEAMYESEERRLTVELSPDPAQDSVAVRIGDTGSGIPADEVDRIFDPFYTSKPLVSQGDEPVGTGLGLASVREIVQSYRGEIEVASEPGKGTEFVVRFPACTEECAI